MDENTYFVDEMEQIYLQREKTRRAAIARHTKDVDLMDQIYNKRELDRRIYIHQIKCATYEIRERELKRKEENERARHRRETDKAKRIRKRKEYKENLASYKDDPTKGVSYITLPHEIYHEPMDPVDLIKTELGYFNSGFQYDDVIPDDANGIQPLHIIK